MSYISQINKNKFYRINPRTYIRTEIPTTVLSISNNKLGEGSQGTVYKAIYKFNDNEEKIVAVKRVKMSNNEEKNKNLHLTGIYNEVKILNQINHDGVIKFIDFICDTKYYYLVLEFIEGWDLLTFVLEGYFKDLDELAQLNIFLQCAKIISYLHQNNIVHLDIKPENIMLMPLAGKSIQKTLEFRVIFIDFSFSKMNVSDNAYLKLYAGSVQYADPDTLCGIPYLAKAADIWTFGVTIHRTLTLNNLFDVSTDNLFYDKICKKHAIDYNFLELKLYVPLLKTILVYDSHKRVNINTIIRKLERIQNKIINANDNNDNDNNNNEDDFDHPLAFINHPELPAPEINDNNNNNNNNLDANYDNENSSWFSFSSSMPSIRRFISSWYNSISEK